MYESDIETYCVYRGKGKDETRKTRNALVKIAEILSVNGHTWPEDSDILAYRSQATSSERAVNQDIVRIEKFFEWKKEKDSMEEEATLEMFPEETQPKSNAGRKPISENGEKKSEKLMLYLTPELIGEVRDWCYLKRISAVSYITGLIEADLHSNEKQEKLAVFRRLSDEA